MWMEISGWCERREWITERATLACPNSEFVMKRTDFGLSILISGLVKEDI